MSAIKRIIKLITIVSIAWWVAGCATTQQISSEDKAKIKTVQINDAVEKGKVFLLVPSGGAISSNISACSEAAFVAYLAQNSISIEKIVREEFELAVRNSGKLALANSSGGAAPVIKIKVPQYGFGTTHLLSSNVVPVLQIQCDMVDASGRLVWSASERMLPSVVNPIDAMTWSQVVSNPKKIEEQLRKASKYLAEKIMKDF